MLQLAYQAAAAAFTHGDLAFHSCSKVLAGPVKGTIREPVAQAACIPHMLPTVCDIAMVSAGHRSSSGKQGSAKGHTGPGSGKGKAGSGRSAKAAVPGSKGSQASAEPPPQESFYVYESVMPPEVRGIVQQLLHGWHCCCMCNAIMFQACSAIFTVAILYRAQQHILQHPLNVLLCRRHWLQH